MSYSECTAIERESLERLEPYLEQISDGRYIRTHKGKLSQLLQERAGDIIWNHTTKGHMLSLELKAEEFNTHKNLFLESWSNKQWFNPGWFWKSEADYLLYHFLYTIDENDERQRTDEMYVVALTPLRKWAFETVTVSGVPRWRIARFPERLQSKHKQLNDTWGFCVPIQVILDEVPSARRVYLPEASAA